MSVYETERRLRELNGVLDLAVCVAVDVIREHDDHGLSAAEWQRRLVGAAAKKLTAVGQFPGRLSLFTDDELRAFCAGITDEFDGEVKFEMARRGMPRQEVLDAGAIARASTRDAGDDSASDGERGGDPRVEGGHG